MRGTICQGRLAPLVEAFDRVRRLKMQPLLHAQALSNGSNISHQSLAFVDHNIALWLTKLACEHRDRLYNEEACWSRSRRGVYRQEAGRLDNKVHHW